MPSIFALTKDKIRVCLLPQACFGVSKTKEELHREVCALFLGGSARTTFESSAVILVFSTMENAGIKIYTEGWTFVNLWFAVIMLDASNHLKILHAMTLMRC